MIIATRLYIRTDISVPWHIDQPFENSIHPNEFKNHVANAYGNKKTHQSYTLSDDGLTLTFQSVWVSLEAYQEYMNDPICMAVFNRRTAHNTQFRIINNPATIEEV